MRLALAVDYDRTLTDESFVPSAEVLECLERAREEMEVIIASGRELRFFRESGLLGLGDALVLENGAVVYVGGGTFVQNGPTGEIRDRLDRKGIPFSSGEVIVSVKRIHETEARDALEGLDLSLECNRDSLMILPKGVDKGSGVLRAIDAMGAYQILACIGDGENDLSLFRVADIKGAVANAVPELKTEADYVCKNPYGRGVMEFIEHLASTVARRGRGRSRPGRTGRGGGRAPSR